MIWLIILFFISILLNIFQGWNAKRKASYQKDFQESYNRITQDNQKLQKAMYKINEIEKRRVKENEKIDNAPDSNIFDIINNSVRNPKG